MKAEERKERMVEATLVIFVYKKACKNWLRLLPGIMILLLK